MTQTALVTGAGGTVGRVLVGALDAGAWDVVAWDRAAHDPFDRAEIAAFLKEVHPDVVFHLAVASEPTGRPDEAREINVEWPTEIARLLRRMGGKLVFASSVMVFTDEAEGPFYPDSDPDVEDGYGHEKLLAERALHAQNPDVVVARLAWQIADAPGSNNMVDFLETTNTDEGAIRASEDWLPACSFLPDTADALVRLAAKPGGIYLIDSNEHWNFFQIATALNEVHGGKWNIEATRHFQFDQRMIDPRVEMPSLNERLPDLP